MNCQHDAPASDDPSMWDRLPACHLLQTGWKPVPLFWAKYRRAYACWRMAAWLGILLMSAASAAEARLELAFDAALLDDKQFIVSYEKNFLTVDDSGMRIKWLQQPAPFRGFSAKTRFALVGDFAVDYLFDVGQIGKPASGWGSGILLRLDFYDRRQTGVSIQRQCLRDGSQVVGVDQTTYMQAEHQVQIFPITEEIDGLRVTRHRNELRVQGLKSGGVIASYGVLSVSNAPVNPLAFYVHSGEAIADLDVTLKRMILEAEAFVDPAMLSRFGPKLKWLAAVLFGIGLGAAVYHRLRQPC